MIAFGPFRTRRALVLLAINAVLVACLLWVCLKGVGMAVAVAPSSEPLGLADLTRSMPAGIDVQQRYAALVASPVFHSDRKFIPDRPVVAPPVPEAPPPAYELTGYFALPGRPAKVFLRQQGGGSNVTAVIGDLVDGWTLVSANTRRAVFRQNGREVEITKPGSASSSSMPPSPMGQMAPLSIPRPPASTGSANTEPAIPRDMIRRTRPAIQPPPAPSP